MSGVLALLAAIGSELVSLSGGTFSAVRSGTSAISGVTLNTTGTLEQNTNGILSTVQNWYTPTTTSIGSSYWVRATLTSGVTPSGTLNTWLQLSSKRSWTVTKAVVGTDTANLSLSIATDSAGTNIVATGAYSLVATRAS